MYELKGKTTRIVATSRGAIKIKDNYYTIECTEERSIPDTDDVNMEVEWSSLFDSINTVVDNQLGQVVGEFDKH